MKIDHQIAIDTATALGPEWSYDEAENKAKDGYLHRWASLRGPDGARLWIDC